MPTKTFPSIHIDVVLCVVNLSVHVHPSFQIFAFKTTFVLREG